MKKLSVLFIVLQFGLTVCSQFSDSSPISMSDNWEMYRHDLAHTGYSSSKVPDSIFLLWKKSMPDLIYASSPSVVNNRLYIGCYDTYMYCLNATTGDIIWKFKTGDSIDSSPAVINNKVIFGSRDDYVYCVDNDGKLIWKFKTSNNVGSSPAVFNSRVFIGSYDTYLYCLNENNGNLVWKEQMGGSVDSSPAVYNNKVYISSYGNIVRCISETGTIIWTYNLPAASFSSPAIANGKVFVGCNDKKLYCLNADTGGLVWSKSTGGEIHSSPGLAEDKVIVGSMDHKVYCLEQSTGALVWSYATGGGIYSSPAISGSKVFIGSWDNHIYCINLTTGNLIWKYKLMSTINSSPAIYDGKVFIGCNDWNVYCFGNLTLPPRILKFTPGNNETNVSLSTKITVSFSNPMNKVSAENAFSINPPISGSFSWKDDQTMIFTPDSNLASETTYTVRVDKTATDVTGKHLDKNYQISFRTIDVTPPMILDTIPKHGAKNVSVNTTIEIRFNEPMNKTSTENAFSINPKESGNFSWYNYTLIFKPLKQLQSEKVYVVNISTQAKDIAGNPLTKSYEFSFTTEDIIPPSVLRTEPLDGETNVSVDIKIKIRFSEPMNKTSVYKAFSIIPFVSGNFTWDLNTLILIPAQPLHGETKYVVSVSNTAKDLAGNYLKGFQFSFYTVDNIRPYVIDTSPKDGATFVLPVTTVNITFNEFMNKQSVEPAFGIWPYVSGTFVWSDKTMIYVPFEPLKSDTTYVVNVSEKATDLCGNPVRPFQFRFTTIDCSQPYVVKVFPENGSIVPENILIRITFNEIMDDISTTHAFSISPYVEGTYTLINETMIFSPMSLQSNTKYSVTISQYAQDLSKNMLREPYTFIFYTKDFINPYVVETHPSNNSKNVSLDTHISITFSEAMDRSRTKIEIIPTSYGKIIWKNVTLIFIPDEILFPSTLYTVSIDSSATDLSGNPLEPYKFVFTTLDNVKPKIVSITPSNGERNVSIKKSIKIVFNEPVTLVKFLIYPKSVGDIYVEDSVVVYKCILNYSTVYTVTIIVEDLAGNSITHTWSFETEYHEKEEETPQEGDFEFGIITILVISGFSTVVLVNLARPTRKRHRR